MTTESRREFEKWLKRNPDLKCFHPEQAAYIAWQAARERMNDEYCPLSDPNHPHGKQFREDSPPTSEKI